MKDYVTLAVDVVMTYVMAALAVWWLASATPLSAWDAVAAIIFGWWLIRGSVEEAITRAERRKR